MPHHYTKSESGSFPRSLRPRGTPSQPISLDSCDQVEYWEKLPDTARAESTQSGVSTVGTRTRARRTIDIARAAFEATSRWLGPGSSPRAPKALAECCEERTSAPPPDSQNAARCQAHLANPRSESEFPTSAAPLTCHSAARPRARITDGAAPTPTAGDQLQKRSRHETAPDGTQN